MKKANLLYLLSILLITSCTQTIDYFENDEYFSITNDILYYKGSPFTGVVENYFEKNKIPRELEYRTYKDGKLDGRWEKYYSYRDYNGQLHIKGAYKDGVEDGRWEKYEEDGRLERATIYKDGVEDGLYEEYFNGQLLSKGAYKDGVRDGLWEQYDEYGQLEIKATFKDGRRIN